MKGAQLGALIGGFEAGLGNRRLKGFQPSRAHLNTLIAASGADITAWARWLIRNNGYAANAIESWAGNVVGAGIKPSSLLADAGRKAAVQKLWLAWTDEADADGLTDFYGLQRRAAREVFIAGEVFFRFRPRRSHDGLQVPLQLQLLPAEMLPLTRNETLPGGTVIRQGIEFDRIGKRVAYHFLRRHPGDVTDPGLVGETVRIPASEIIHVIDPVDGGRLRGVSKFAPAIVKLFLLDQYDDAELDRKKVAAMHALFITTPAPAEPFDGAESTGSDGERSLDLQPGQIVMRNRASRCRPPIRPTPAPPTSCSSIGHCCRSRRHSASRTPTSPTTCCAPTTPTPAWRCWSSAGGPKPTSTR